MHIKKWIVVASLSLTGLAANANPEADAQALALLDSLNMEQVFDQTIEKSLDLQLKQNPTLLPYKGVMRKFFQKYMSYQSMKGELVAIYSRAFTTQELKEITTFYRTATGRKTVSLMPELFAKGGELGTRRIQEHLPEFMSMMADEAARLQESQSRQ